MFVIVIGTDDALHEHVAHYVAFVEEVEGNAVDPFEDLSCFDQSAAARIRQIDLRDVARDHRLGVEAQTSNEHLHLFGGSVLRLVEDDEAVVERPSSHEGDGGDLDDVALQIAVDLLLVEQVVERVVQRAQIGIHFLLQSTGEKSEALAGFYRRAREDDAVHLLVDQGSDRHGHGKIGLACAGWPDAEYHVVLLDGLDIAALIEALGLYDALAERALPSGFGEPAQCRRWIGDHDL